MHSASNRTDCEWLYSTERAHETRYICKPYERVQHGVFSSRISCSYLDLSYLHILYMMDSKTSIGPVAPTIVNGCPAKTAYTNPQMAPATSISIVPCMQPNNKVRLLPANRFQEFSETLSTKWTCVWRYVKKILTSCLRKIDIFCHNFGKCRPVFIIFPLLNSESNNRKKLPPPL